MSIFEIPIIRKTVKTNNDAVYTYRVTGNYSAGTFFCDVTKGDATKLFSASITVTYDGATYSTIIITFSKANINLYMTPKKTYYADLKLDGGSGDELNWFSFELNCITGHTATT